MYTTPFGFSLRGYRKRRGYTLKNFAVISGSSESYLSRMENGICTPTDPTLLEKLGNALQLSEQEKNGLLIAAQESQKFIQLPADLSVKGYSVSHHFLRAVAKMGEKELIQIDQICRNHIREEDLCPSFN